MTSQFYLPPPILFMFPFINAWLRPSPSAFSAAIQVTIEKIAPTLSALTVTPPPQVTLPPLVLLSNVTFVVVGNMVPNFVQFDSLVCTIQENMWLITVHLHTFQLNRPPISMGLIPTWDRNCHRGILIELGVRLYEGGNVTIHILHHCVYLFSFLQCTHLLWGWYSYNWFHCLYLVGSHFFSLFFLC
jgi:hypothetical protein